MDPVIPEALTLVAEPEETFIVRVDSTKGQHYWFSDRRLLRQDVQGIGELFAYEAVDNGHWMFRDRTLWSAELKATCFDRLEIESRDGLVVLDGLDQAYLPVLRFLRWTARPSAPPIS